MFGWKTYGEASEKGTFKDLIHSCDDLNHILLLNDYHLRLVPNALRKKDGSMDYSVWVLGTSPHSRNGGLDCFQKRLLLRDDTAGGCVFKLPNEDSIEYPADWYEFHTSKYRG